MSVLGHRCTDKGVRAGVHCVNLFYLKAISVQVTGPGHVTVLPRSLRPCHSHSFWSNDFKLAVGDNYEMVLTLALRKPFSPSPPSYGEGGPKKTSRGLHT